MSFGPALDRAAQALRAACGDDGGIPAPCRSQHRRDRRRSRNISEEGVSCFAAPGRCRPDQAPERNPTRPSDGYFGFFFHRVEYRLHLGEGLVAMVV